MPAARTPLFAALRRATRLVAESQRPGAPSLDELTDPARTAALTGPPAALAALRICMGPTAKSNSGA